LLGPRYPVKNAFTLNDHYNRKKELPIKIEIDCKIETGTHTLSFDESKEKHQLSVNPFIALDDEMRQSLFSCAYVGSERKIVEYMPSDRWSLLGKILLDINEEFKNTKDRDGKLLHEKFKQEMDRIRDQYLFQAGRNHRVPEDKQETNIQKLKRILQEESANQLNKSLDDLKLDLSLTDPWHFYRTLQIIITDFGQDFQAAQMGMGVQASLSIAILRAYGELKLKNKPPIFIDEPELYMHPQAQRNFYCILRELTKDKKDENGEVQGGLQIFYTTHSPDFLDAGQFDEIFLVRRTISDSGADEGTKIFAANPTAFVEDWEVRNPGKTSKRKTILSLYQNALQQTGDTQKANEAFFARKIILVEGGTEMFGLPVFLDALGFNLDKHGISIVSVGGKTELDRFYRLYNEFGIPTYVIFDGDANEMDGKKREKNANLNRALQELLGLTSPVDFPKTTIHSRFTSFEDKYETTLREKIDNYSKYESECNALGGKPIKGLLCAQKAVDDGHIPEFIKFLSTKIQNLKWNNSCLKTKDVDLEPF
jgi:putative ATP-dependent endonuclease of OLD family